MADSAGGAAQESNLPTVGLPRPAGFEDGQVLGLGAGLQVVSDHLSDHRSCGGTGESRIETPPELVAVPRVAGKDLHPPAWDVRGLSHPSDLRVSRGMDGWCEERDCVDAGPLRDGNTGGAHLGQRGEFARAASGSGGRRRVHDDPEDPPGTRRGRDAGALRAAKHRRDGRRSAPLPVRPVRPEPRGRRMRFASASPVRRRATARPR